MRNVAWVILLFVGLSLLSACGSGSECPGKQGCPCDAEKLCTGGLTCEEGTCRQTNDAGEPPATDGGEVQEKPACVQGSLGCRCLASGKCNDSLRCDQGTCRECPEGTAGCACGKESQCETGLKCEAGLCQGCTGQAFCPCYGNNSCDKGNICETAASGAMTCLSCKERKDKTGCNCDSDTECGDGRLCVNHRCVDPSVMKQIPKHPKCYTSCEGDVQLSDGTISSCHPRYGLRVGCVDTQVCEEGSCVSATFTKTKTIDPSAYPFCLKDNDCPDWQACISGRCYSNCQSDSQCVDGFSCHRYVCRRKCTLQKSTCDDSKDKSKCQVCDKEQVCQSTGSTENEGVCMPLATRQISADEAGTARTQTKEVFLLGARELSLTNVASTNEIAIKNKGTFALQLEISRESDDLKSKNPLSWIKFDRCKTYNDDKTACSAYEGKPTSANPFKVELPANTVLFLKVSNAENGPSSAKAYKGTFVVKSAEMQQKFTLDYRSTGTGRWKGKFFSIGNFEADKIEQLTTTTNVRTFPNAFLRRWLNFKSNAISFDQFKAVLLSIQSETWRQPQVKKACSTLFSQQATGDVACYPYSSSKGYEILSISTKEAPVPTGVSSLPFAIDVKEGGSNDWTGRIVTSETLQYPGDPQIKLHFDGVPGAKERVAIKSLSATSILGGRYLVTKSKPCHADTFPKAIIPWLVPGFIGVAEPSGGLLPDYFECQQKTAPKSIPEGASKEVIASIEAFNQSMSRANPIPNGRILQRKIELVDGMLYRNSLLFAIVRERLVSPFAAAGSQSTIGQDWVRYGYLLLERTNLTLSDKDTKGNTPAGCSSNADCASNESCQSGACTISSALQQVSCTPDVVRKAINQNIQKDSELASWSTSRLEGLVMALINGQVPALTQQVATIQGQAKSNGTTVYSYENKSTKSTHYIHYLCRDTKQFNGGPTDNPTDCPEGSEVIFFELKGVSESAIRKMDCQALNTCDLRYEQLKTTAGFRANVPYQCAKNQTDCQGSNRKDLRDDKIFFPPQSEVTSGYIAPFVPLRQAVLQAFRYRTKFQSRDGKGIGFVPTLCSKTAPSSTPYCYDPGTIEQIEERINCLEFLFTQSSINQKIGSSTKGVLRAFLSDAFGYSNSTSAGGAILTHPGFETLNAELRVMLGDDAYVKALGSRYDLAQSQLISFEGSRFEANGINLSGVVGTEMFYLYLSVQHYQSVLDRFYAQTPVLSVSLQARDGSFVTAETVTSYIQKMLLAATRKARSLAQIARKYHILRRSDLAKQVLERAYVSSYLEQVLLTQLLRTLAKSIDQKSLDQVRTSIETISRTYNSALLDMQETYEKVNRSLDYFGFPDGYVPLPALDSFSSSSNRQTAFSVSLVFAKQVLADARDKETTALASSRSFDASAAQFQSELVKIENNYNDQLIELCGALQDGNRQLPAIPRYAALATGSLKEGNPCGKLSGSAIYDAYLSMEKVALNNMQVNAQYGILSNKIKTEADRIRQTCDNNFALTDISWDYQNQKIDLQFALSTTDFIVQQLIRSASSAAEIVMGWKCEELFGGAIQGGDCFAKNFSNAKKIQIFLAREATSIALNLSKREKEKELATLNAEFSRFQLRTNCSICENNNDQSTCSDGFAKIASQNYIAQLVLELKMVDYRAINAEINLRQAAAQIEQLKQQAERLIQEQNDAVNMLTEVQSAANDPNQRIYKNDAVISAERTFNLALREAYRLTLIYEYYTGTTYAKKSDLLLVRMVTKGDINLETYLSQLEQAYRDFEEANGRQDLRVAVISLKNHIINIPKLDKDGTPYTNEQRSQMFQQALSNRDNFDREGFLRFAFALSVDDKSRFVSPATYGHKIAYVEAEIQGTDVGDDGVGRIYLRQNGTGVVRTADNNFKYYALPQRTAVINPYFNGTKIFTPEIYQNYRLQDRPLGNTQWEFLFNQVSEKANQDINLNSISDVVLYVYYRDFTK